MTDNKLNDLQIGEFEILKEFIKICNELGLHYYMVAGSMLGTYRHHGFIPWDDDIDVGMPRKDYDVLIREAPKILNNKYYLTTPEDENHLTLGAQIISNGKKYQLNNASNKIETGAWIDIMAIDGVPNPGIKRLIHWYHYLILRGLFQISNFSDIVDVHRKRPIYEKIIIKIVSVIHFEKVLNSSKIAKNIDKLLRKVNFNDSHYVATYCGCYRKKEIFRKDVYGKGSSYLFENITVTGVDKPEVYLEQLYGDFMTPPTREEDRSRHNVSEIEEK